MTIDTDIETLKLQEQRLQFSKFDEADAWALGSHMREQAVAKHLPLVIEIRLGRKQMFYSALPGTTEDNGHWARRKYNTVMRFEGSSYRIGLQHQQRGAEFGPGRGIDGMEYAAAGGGFPIIIKGTGVIGAALVSGVPQREDHAFVAECLANYLEVPYRDIALPLEEPA
jgi:uncharacterized protein (UPF0303 family)